MFVHDDLRENRRRFFRRHLFWIAPLALAAGTGAFLGVGVLVAWLWRVTLGDIFGLKPISFWQAWGLILLSQILFKANLQRNVPVRPTHRGRFGRDACAAPAPAGPEPEI